MRRILWDRCVELQTTALSRTLKYSLSRRCSSRRWVRLLSITHCTGTPEMKASEDGL